MNDRVTGLSKGFAFVEFANDAEAQATIKGLDGTDVNGQAVVVNEARSKKDAPKPAPAVQH